MSEQAEVDESLTPRVTADFELVCWDNRPMEPERALRRMDREAHLLFAAALEAENRGLETTADLDHALCPVPLSDERSWWRRALFRREPEYERHRWELCWSSWTGRVVALEPVQCSRCGRVACRPSYSLLEESSEEQG